MEVDAELGMEEWPRGAPSRGVVALRRVCGLLMMDPCRREKKVTACPSDSVQELQHSSCSTTATRHQQDEFTLFFFR